LHTVLHEETVSSGNVFMMHTWPICPSVLQIQTSFGLHVKWWRAEAHVN
jgi:hypothetical protein